MNLRLCIQIVAQFDHLRNTSKNDVLMKLRT